MSGLPESARPPLRIPKDAKLVKILFEKTMRASLVLLPIIMAVVALPVTSESGANSSAVPILT